jgi:hypothetical protein
MLLTLLVHLHEEDVSVYPLLLWLHFLPPKRLKVFDRALHTVAPLGLTAPEWAK